MSFTPAQLTASIQRVVPGFRMTYLPDFREGIARSWPASIDDSAARADWGWRPAYALDVRLNWLPTSDSRMGDQMYAWKSSGSWDHG